MAYLGVLQLLDITVLGLQTRSLSYPFSANHTFLHNEFMILFNFHSVNPQ
jgi:hypothetical protein